MFGLAAIPAGLLLVGTLFQPESPHWLASRGRDDEARHILERYREAEDIDAELDDIHQVADQKVSGRRLLDPRLRGVLTLGVMMAIFQQVTGINTVIYYAPTLLHGAGLGSSAALLANVINGAVNVGMTVVAIRLLDRTGRRPLLLAGTAGMAVGMMVVGCTFGIGGDRLHGATALVAVLGLLIYTGSFAIGLGPVFWLLISEIYPQQVRGPAMSVATLANWTANFVVTVSFLTLLNAIHGVGVFFLFGALTVVALVYFAKRVPETKNLSLEEIQRQIEGSRSSTFAPSGPSATTSSLPTIGGRLSPS
jgi:sugar porter (SP) family MFS transporter